jgi:hypothetical protein
LSEQVLNNQTHFGKAAQAAFRAHSEAAGAAVRGSTRFFESVGAASHYLQDQYALGHMFPGTHLLAGKWGVLPRGIIHQTFGGEATFRAGQFNATRHFFEKMAATSL